MNLTDFSELRQVVELFDIKKKAIVKEQSLNSGEILEIANFEEEVFADTASEIYTILPDGSVKKVMLYIPNAEDYYAKYGKLPKFHIYKCQFVNMKNEYYKTSTINGKFLLLFGEKREFGSLELCRRCKRMYWDKYNKVFNFKDFLFSNVMNGYENIEDEYDAIPRKYVKNWKQISSYMRKMRNYCCEECGINLEKYRKYLHVHHKNSNLKDNTYFNLKVLCIECHSNQPGHQHIKREKEYLEFIREIKWKAIQTG